MLTTYDYAVVALYFVLLLGLGWLFRRFSHDSSEYFRGGGEMAWWLVGASAFMASFSAWTFTGAAGLAYEFGIVVLVMYFANTLAFFLNALWLAAPCRQMRVVVVMEAVRARLGRVNEQFFTWMTLPLQVVGSAITLYGLAIFCAPAFGFDLRVTILVAGMVVLLVSTVGGSWAVATSDFLQALMLIGITLVVFVSSLFAVGGPSRLLAKLPPSHFDITASHAAGMGVLWVIATVLERVAAQNTLLGATRYLSARTGREARKAAVLAGVLFGLGSLIWFVPPLVARALDLDMAAMLPGLVKPAEGAYVAMAHRCLPAGLLGLMVTGMISATMSSMDHGLNRNSGIFVRSFYRPILRPRAGERELVMAGRSSTIIFGLLIILLALLYSTWKDVGVLKLMLNASVMLGIPAVIPMIWCLLTRRAPDWAAWSTVLICLGISALFGLLPSLAPLRTLAASLGWGAALDGLRENSYAVIALTSSLVGSAWYLGCGRVSGSKVSAQRAEEIAHFFHDMERPLGVDEISDPSVISAQSLRIGRMALLWGGLMYLLLLVPNPLWGRVAVAFCASFVAGVGLLLVLSARRSRLSRMPVPAHDVPSVAETP
ncbi:transporter [Spartobacteria bacterium LR76]|nr:transporter [Spartobacteria bacterium LR76]